MAWGSSNTAIVSGLPNVVTTPAAGTDFHTRLATRGSKPIEPLCQKLWIRPQVVLRWKDQSGARNLLKTVLQHHPSVTFVRRPLRKQQAFVARHDARHSALEAHEGVVLDPRCL